MTHYEMWMYWYTKDVLVAPSAANILRTFIILQGEHHSFARWFQKGYSLEEALLNKVDLNEPTYFQNEIKKQIDIDSEFAILGLWNGDVDDACSLSITLSTGPIMPMSSLHISFADSIQQDADYFQIMPLSGLLVKLAQVWPFEYGVIRSTNYLSSRKDVPRVSQIAGWINYLSKDLVIPQDLPSDMLIVPLKNGSHTIAITPRVFDVSNPTHVELARQYEAKLLPDIVPYRYKNDYS